jgi:antitoxin (DNA-binding transcriptional repressor) of toxin-antitoxin stability system
MKTVDLVEFAANINQYLLESITEDVVITRAGKPCAIVHGLDYDEEQIELANSEEFWAMIEERRRGPTIPWEVAKQQLDLLDQKEIEQRSDQ